MTIMDTVKDAFYGDRIKPDRRFGNQTAFAR